MTLATITPEWSRRLGKAVQYVRTIKFADNWGAYDAWLTIAVAADTFNAAPTAVQVAVLEAEKAGPPESWPMPPLPPDLQKLVDSAQ